ncbi:hypothetical protein DUNSADRAFT_8979 [Dunaliella salina]|uniref:Uncharacterized protein n=1 Tax=Dunaliella salina TaxID=3046 RepID=A0ABQ7GIF3_DUNSA|nr:hypothetical protein DUNSADRAFT_8979 [Dunaliella salina]|eukprot:KAF5834356.1 hypothetical protein DUNSADRAFT_8979 [Dunaliella salina]
MLAHVQMDRDMSSMMGQARQAEAQARAQADALWYDVNNDGIRIRRGEEQGMGSYRYYESISISSGPGHYVSMQQQPVPTTGVSPLVFVAAMLAGAYAVLAAAFAKNFNLTIYSPKYRPWMSLAWPFILPFNKSFRTQFLAAIKGQRPPLPGREDQQEQQQQQQQGDL